MPAVPPTPFAVSHLFAPCDAETFDETYWEQAPLHIERQDPAYYDAVLTESALDAYLQGTRIRPGDLAVKRDGEDLPLEFWAPRTGSERLVDRAQLFQLFDRGCAIHLRNPHHELPALARFHEGFASALELPVDTEAVITPSGACSALRHSSQSLFILPITGRSAWRVHEPAAPFPLQEHTYPDEASASPVAHDWTLSPGDLLYLPSGVPFSVSAPDGPVVYLILACRSPRWLDLLQALAHTQEGFRRALPVPFADKAEVDDLADAFVELSPALGDIDAAEAVLDGFRQQFHTDRLTGITSSLSDRLHLGRLIPASRVRRVSSRPIEVAENGRMLTVTIGTRRLSFPAGLAPAVTFIARGEAFLVEDLPGGMADAMKVELVKRFIREGVLERA